MPHRRSKETYMQRVKQYKTPREEMQFARTIVLDFSWQDPYNREKVFVEDDDFQGTIIQKLIEAFGDISEKRRIFIFEHVFVSHKPGDVLNRFPLLPFPSHKYLGRGAFQK